MLAEHFFSKLVVSPNYVYDISTIYDTRKRCPCDDHDDMVGKPGDTSFGKHGFYLQLFSLTIFILARL